MDSCVRAYHAYNEIWTAVLGEVLITERELHNVANRYTVAVKRHSGETVGHLLERYRCFVACSLIKVGT